MLRVFSSFFIREKDKSKSCQQWNQPWRIGGISFPGFLVLSFVVWWSEALWKSNKKKEKAVIPASFRLIILHHLHQCSFSSFVSILCSEGKIYIGLLVVLSLSLSLSPPPILSTFLGLSLCLSQQVTARIHLLQAFLWQEERWGPEVLDLKDCVYVITSKKI